MTFLKYTIIFLILLPNGLGAVAEETSQVTIYLARFQTTDTLKYIADSLHTTIQNLLASFPVKVYDEASSLDAPFQNVASILKMDKVHLLQIRRETGFDGLITGVIDAVNQHLQVTLHLVDFSSGRIYYSGQLEGRFGSELLKQLEDRLQNYANALIRYYRSTLSVTSQPSGAAVYVNGEMVGATPIESLDVGEEMLRVEIRKAEYVSYVKEIHLHEGQKGAIHAQLYRPTLTVLSDPEGAAVYVNEKHLGDTPIQEFLLETSQLTLRLSKDGYADYRQELTLKPEEHAFIYARLYDLITEHLRHKRGRWQLDSHNWGMGSRMQIPASEGIDLAADVFLTFRYLAKFSRWNLGLEATWGHWEANQRFDTFLGADTGRTNFDVSLKAFEAVGQYNLFERLNQFDVYAGVQGGLALMQSNQPQTSKIVGKLRRPSPIFSGELGLRYYFGHQVKLSAFVGGSWVGQLEYARKIATYWGEPQYERQELTMNLIYAGLTLTYSFWPALR